jgi:hypothetical protein
LNSGNIYIYIRKCGIKEENGGGKKEGKKPIGYK